MKTFVLCIATFLVSTPVLAAEPFEGTWRLIPEKSHLSNRPDAIATATMTITPLGANAFRSSIDATLRSGKAERYAVDRTLDGKEHPTVGKNIPTEGRTSIAERVNSRTRKWVGKKDGKFISEDVATVSSDGKTMRITDRTANGARYGEFLEKQ